MAATGYTPISLYYSATASAVPLAANLTAGELALNTNDGKLYYKNSGGTVAQIAGPGAAGDFTNLTVTGNTTLGDASTDTVTVNGYMGVGGAGSSAIGLRANHTALTGVSQDGIQSAPTGTSAATTQIRAFSAQPGTAAAAFTCASVFGYRALNAVLGAGSTITNQYGFYVDDQTNGSNNYGAFLNVSSGSNKWNIYASGTAQNYFAGNVGVGTSSPTRKLHVVGSNATAFLADSGTDNTIAIFQSSNAQANLDITGSGARFRIGAIGTGEFFLSTGTTSTYTERLRIDSSGKVGIGTNAPAVTLAVSATDAMLVPAGTTAQRPTGAAGYIRYNSTTGQFEGYTTAWGAIGGGATGGGGEQVFWENETSVDTSYTITAGKNAGTFGPVTVASGVTVTVPSGSVWSVV